MNIVRTLRTRLALFAVPFCLLVGNAFGAQVTYTVGGSSGAWTLDFSVTNDYGVTGTDIYFFGVNVPGGSLSGSPTAAWSSFGPYLSQNISWLNYGVNIPDMIQDGETLSGFLVTDTSATAPTSVSWFAYLYDWNTPGSNPLETGTATEATAVPEPTTLVLLGLGLTGIFGIRRSRKHRA